TLNRLNDLIPEARVEGDVQYRGVSLYGAGVSPIAVRRRIGMVFQKPNPFPKSIYDNVAYGPRINGIRNKGKLDEIVERSLRQAALWDEPAAALDPIATGKIEDLMHEIKSRYTIVIVTHNMQQATRVSDRTAFYSVLVDSENDTRTGTLVEYGPTQQIFEDPQDPRTQAYVTGRMG